MARHVALSLGSLGLLAALVAGCATSGIGSGELTTPGKTGGDGTVLFAWDAGTDSTNGDIRAVLPDGRVFDGRFLQVTATTTTQQLGPYWAGWGPWTGWSGGWAGGGTGFVTHYTGRVIATLEGPEGQRMRCQFQLEDPPDGPESGGMGNCELSTGEVVRYAVLTGH
ncbi:MAG: hypothetical protein M3Y87_09475 [Myxococcota bacterium]|nr:hypothetical protein [Myxococcota bacterium]